MINEAVPFICWQGRCKDRWRERLCWRFYFLADAFLSLVDQQTPSEWWHVLDTRTGEVVERRHLRTSNGMIGFQRSDWVIGTPAKKAAIALPSTADLDLSDLEVGLRSVVVNGIKNGNGRQNAHTNGGSE